MNLSARRVLGGLGSAFAVYLGIRGLAWGRGAVREPAVMIGAVAVYLIVAGVCILWEPRRDPAATPPDAGYTGPTRLPVWACALGLATAVAVPLATVLTVDRADRLTPSGTWYLGAVGLLMTVLMVRRRPWCAWLGTLVLAVAATVSMGLVPALTLGLVGSVMWVAAAQLLLLLLDRAAHDTARLAQLQQTASAWRAAQRGRERERRVQVRRALEVAGPVLTRAVAAGGVLDDAQREQARRAEARLRDELRGARLLDDDVRARVDAARRRGATVTVVDEGGLDGLDETQLARIRAEIAAVLGGATAPQLYVRSSPDPVVAVTIVGRSPSADGGDDDVPLWHEIPRRGPGRD